MTMGGRPAMVRHAANVRILLSRNRCPTVHCHNINFLDRWSDTYPAMSTLEGGRSNYLWVVTAGYLRVIGHQAVKQ